ncbi:MAG: 50S ribosomal protein L2 [Candidatus Helarchaeales archaeon]
MGKRILVQRKSSKVFRAPTHKAFGKVKYLPPSDKPKLSGIIQDITHEPRRGAPLARVKFENDVVKYQIIPESVHVGKKIEIGPKADLELGNVLPLIRIPEGIPICNIEGKPGDGGKYIRASGCYGTIQSRSPEKVIVKMKSGQLKAFNPTCRATIGIVAGGGRPEKPFVKAGKKFHLIRAKGRKWPIVRGVAMNACSHPHGGGGHQHIGKKGSCVSRNAPPGRKVGLIAARRSGKKKK